MATTELSPPTENFQISYDPTLPNALANAQQLARTVELDFQTLTAWFGIGSGFGPGNRVLVTLIYQGGHGSDNYGDKSDGSTTLELNGAPFSTPVADVIRMHFIAEFSEVLMSYNNQHGPTTWRPNYSHGEGLSQYLAYTIAPLGYTGFYGGPQFENVWLASNRQANDWVDNTEATDQDSSSYGCALLFLFYLNSQLNYSTAQIVQAGADTLAQTYQELTGKNDGFTSFLNLLNLFYPPAQQGAKLDVVNPFPLLTGAARRVTIDGSYANVGNPVVVSTGLATVKPFFSCPEKDYSYQLLGQPYTLTLIAKTYGFGDADFNWLLNGLVLTGQSGTVTVPIHLTQLDPAVPGGVISLDEKTTFDWQVTSEMRTSTLLLVPTAGTPFGNYELRVDVNASEVYPSLPSAANTDFEGVDNERVQWEQAYYDDRARCERPFLEAAHRYAYANQYLQRLLNWPDPPRELTSSLNVIRELAQELESVHKEAPAIVIEGVRRILHEQLGVSAEALLRLLPDQQLSLAEK